MRINLIKICHWEITKRCNISCIHCISSVGNKRELNTEEALKVIDNLKDIGCKELYITGGEPFIREDIFEILKKAKKKKFKIGLITNGLLITKKNITKIKLYVNELGISLDGASSQINDKIRGKGTFKKILKSVELVKSFHIPLTLYITLTKINFQDLENILNLSSALKIKRLRIVEVSLRGRAYKNRNLLKIPKNIKKEFKKYLLKILKKYFPLDMASAWDQTCSINSKTIFLSSLGYIYPCIEIFQENPSCHFGNIRKLDLKNFQRYKKFISQISNKKCPYEELRGNNFSICLNSLSIKSCPIKKKICQLEK